MNRKELLQLISFEPPKSDIVTRWPKTMPALTAKHFKRMTWCGESVRSAINEAVYSGHAQTTTQLNKLAEQLNSCGTPRCAVGNVMSAFNRDPRSEAWQDSKLHSQVNNNKGPMAKFIKRFAEHLGGAIDTSKSDIIDQLSDIFEGFRGNIPPTAKKAAEAWNKTLADFGYTVAF